jgi:hypothetical protein
MTPRISACASFAIAGALLVGACGGGSKKASTTTSTPSTEASTSSSEPTTSSTIDPTLKDLLLVAADLPGFKESSNPTPDQALFKTCDPAEAPAFKAVYDAPKEVGSTFVRGKDDAVQVKSIVSSTTAEKAEAGLTELLDAKALSCLEKDVQALAENGKPAGQTITVKLTSAKSTVTGVDQALLLSGTVTVKSGSTSGTSSTAPTSTTSKSSSTTAGSGGTTTRLDAVFLRSAGTILEVDYSGPTALATPTERQKIVAVAARKLAAAASGTGGSSTTVSGASTSSTSGSGSSTTKRSTSTTRQGSSTTKKATTTSSTKA